MGNNGAIMELHNDNRASPHSQAYLQFTQANTQPKIAKELVCFPTLFRRPEKQNQVSA